jgi:hypothetical protein
MPGGGDPIKYMCIVIILYAVFAYVRNTELL